LCVINQRFGCGPPVRRSAQQDATAFAKGAERYALTLTLRQRELMRKVYDTIRCLQRRFGA